MAYARQCDQCKRIIEPRGDRTPKFCPFCGERLTSGPMEVPAGEATGPTHTAMSAVGSLALGILAIPVLSAGLPLGLFAMLLGYAAKRRIMRMPGVLRGAGLADAGIALGMITTIIWLLAHLT